MGSRAVVVVCRDEAAARRRFGDRRRGSGVVFTRTGRPFFADGLREATLPLEAPRRDRGDGPVGRARRPTGSCSTRSSCRGRSRPRSCCAPQYASVGAAATASRRTAELDALRDGARARVSTSADLAAPSGQRRDGATASSTPTAATAGRSEPSATSASRRSRSSPARRDATSSASTPGTWTTADRLAAADPI